MSVRELNRTQKATAGAEWPDIWAGLQSITQEQCCVFFPWVWFSFSSVWHQSAQVHRAAHGPALQPQPWDIPCLQIINLSKQWDNLIPFTFVGGNQDVARSVPRKNQWEGHTVSYDCTPFLENCAAGSSAAVWRTINSIMDHFFSVKWIYSTITPFLLFFPAFSPSTLSFHVGIQ